MLKFKPIEIQDRSTFKTFLDEWQMESSELTFTNLFIWQKPVDIQYAIYDDVLYINMLTESPKRFFLPPIPLKQEMDYTRALGTARQFMTELGLPFGVRAANTKLLQKIKECCKEFLTFEEDRNNFDYVYTAQDLIELSGNKYHGKRNHINKLLQEHACQYVTYDDSYKKQCLELYEIWKLGRENTANEEMALRAALDHMAELELKGGMLIINGRVEAFSIGERISKDMALIHIEKAGNISGTFPYINQQFAEHAWCDVKYINREEDMGIPGLRKAKLSYNPIELIGKYTIRSK